MYILSSSNNKQMGVFPDRSKRLIPWLCRMPEGWELEYIPTVSPETPGKMVCWGTVYGTHFTEFGLAVVKDDGLAEV